LTISSISFITYRFFSIFLAIYSISSGFIRSCDDRISRMITDLTASFDSSSWEYVADCLGGRPLPPFPISSFIFYAESVYISLHLLRMCCISLRCRELAAHSLSCMSASASADNLRSYSMAILLTRGD
jgi:hypothetical protein